VLQPPRGVVERRAAGGLFQGLEILLVSRSQC
jgi:hypothetical protein